MTNNSESFKPNRKDNSFDWLKTDRDFELVYKKGSVIVSNDGRIKARYLFQGENESNRIRAGLSVISKKGNSVWRNRIKRILREIVTKEKIFLQDIAYQKNSNLFIIFSPYSINQNNSRKIFLKNVEPAVLEILNRLKEQTYTNQM